MKKITVDGSIRTMVTVDDECPVCGTPLSEVFFTWGMVHGRATSSCCNATYQLKDFHVDNPSDEMKGFLEMLSREYMCLSIKDEWIEPLKKAMKETGSRDLNDISMVKRAERILAGETGESSNERKTE